MKAENAKDLTGLTFYIKEEARGWGLAWWVCRRSGRRSMRSHLPIEGGAVFKHSLSWLCQFNDGRIGVSDEKCDDPVPLDGPLGDP